MDLIINVHKGMTMEETRESQQAGAAPVAYQPVYPTPQNPYYAPAPPVKAGRWVRFRRLCRLMSAAAAGMARLWLGGFSAHMQGSSSS